MIPKGALDHHGGQVLQHPLNDAMLLSS